ncbi:hypothetical protein NWE60_00135 [Mycoplasmopsis felis]|nr:hypothetical protein [Mycoplasmopsis felis]WAM01106.1 hypothetical protein NWE60_00135 [Mycoplasmopsis felis]
MCCSTATGYADTGFSARRPLITLLSCSPGTKPESNLTGVCVTFLSGFSLFQSYIPFK